MKPGSSSKEKIGAGVTPVTSTRPGYAVTRLPASVPSPINREVVYPHGRYLLYGDGVTAAYRWVWVPNPPPPGSAPVR